MSAPSLRPVRMPVLSRRASLGLMLAALVAIAPRRAAAADAESARAFLEDIYAHYIGPAGTAYGAPWGSDEGVRRYFTAEASALILADRHGATERLEAPYLNGDPFVDSQEWAIDAVDIAIDPITDTVPPTARAVASFVSYGRDVVVELHLVHLDEGWRIGEIVWRDGITLTMVLTREGGLLP